MNTLLANDYGLILNWKCLICGKKHRKKILSYKKSGIHHIRVKCGCGNKTTIPIEVRED